ncbi:hypothetical protein Nit79A3_1426 [Nitrosomonas sp. Is79A3]
MTDDKKITDLSVVRYQKYKAEVELIDGRKLFSDPNFCEHRKFLIDSKSAQVECKDCKTLLNPMWVLEHLCNEETRFMREKKRYITLLREFKKKSKCKCKHCGKFTDIRL